MSHGVRVAISSDILPIGPMVGIYAAVTRKSMSGTVHGPEEALSQAAQLVQGHMDMYSRLSTVEEMETLPEAEAEPEEESVLDSSIDSLELSIRSMNCLKNANIRTLRDLVARSEKDMVEIRNFGEKSLKEVRDKLEVLGLGFGMNLDL